MKPVIGISATAHEIDAGHGKARHHLVPASYLRAVERAGGVPVVLAVVDAPDVAALVGRVDGVVITAGDEDVDPASYGELPGPHVGRSDPVRDAFDFELARVAVERHVPTLAVCRGAQALNVALGGSLVQHVEGHQHADRPKDGVHPVAVKPGSRLEALVGTTDLAVNSLHHQAIGRPAPAARVVARAPDGTAEAVEVPEAGWVLGVQWHPELLRHRDEHLALFAGVVRAAAARAAGASRS